VTAFWTLRAGRLAAMSSRGRRGYHGLRLEDLRLTPPAGGSGTLVRTTSGLLFTDTFNRADGAPGGTYVSDQGTFVIDTNRLTNSSAGNMDRCRFTAVSATDAVYEARLQAPSGGQYAGLRFLSASASTDYHQWVHNGADTGLGYDANTDSRITSLGISLDGNYHVIKAAYFSTRSIRVWCDTTLRISGGGAGGGFTSGAGPTTAGAIGVICYGGQVYCDWLAAYTSTVLTVTGLSAGMGFQLFTSGDVLIGSSGAESGGSATLDTGPLTTGLTDGYVLVYTDQGTWAAPVATARADHTDIVGGDSYTYTP
jgi:hypothetical protein